MQSVNNSYLSVKESLLSLHAACGLSSKPPQLIAVSKRQPHERVESLLQAGHRIFGENQVQEAMKRWQPLKQAYPDVQLHLIGPLQSNKVADAVALFDVIHTLDREKIAHAIKAACDAQNKVIPCFIQVNTGEEPQKSGVAPKELPDFLTFCRDEVGLQVIGLMAIPPASDNPAPHFALLNKLVKRHDLPELSMGMSGDWETAVRFGATYVRLGTAVFGEREA